MNDPSARAAQVTGAGSLAEIEAALGYEFSSKVLLRRALTHASAGNTMPDSDYERLEFLGDRVLGLVIAELMLEVAPDASEGDVALMFNRMVRRDACVAVAEALGLGPHLILSSGEADSGGRHKPTILADACEAVLAALYLDAGFGSARTIIRRLWQPLLVTGAPSTSEDPKTALQEWSQGDRLPIPAYRAVERQGPDHAPSFTVEVHIPGYQPARGTGSNKRMAERQAAEAFLIREHIWRRQESKA